MIIGSEQEATIETRKWLKILLTRAKSDILWGNREEMYDTWQKASEISNIVKDLRNEQVVSTLAPRTKSMLSLLNYLGYVESVGVSLIDIGLMLLIADGKEIHTSRGGPLRHVSKLGELRRLDLNCKIYFLRRNGLGYFANLIDRDLRNDIAHLKFKIDDKGEIRDSSKNVRNIDEIISGFLARVDTILSIFDDVKFLDFLTRKYGEKGS